MIRGAKLMESRVIKVIREKGDLDFMMTMKLAECSSDMLDEIKSLLVEDLVNSEFNLYNLKSNTRSFTANKEILDTKIDILKLAIIRIETIRWTLHNIEETK